MADQMADGDRAINTNLVRYDFKTAASETVPQMVLIRFASRSKPCKDEKPADMVNAGTLKVPPSKPTHAELVCTGADKKNIGLWLGMRPPRAEDYTRKVLKSYLLNASVISSINMTTKVIAYEPNALRVVCVYFEHAHANFFALANPNEEGICEAIECKAHDIFYFAPYRVDTERVFGKRESGWNRKIVKAMGLADRKTESWPKRYDKDKFQVPMPQSRMNDIVGGISTYLPNPGAQTLLLKRALKLLKEDSDEVTEGNEMIF
jgi:hypothetical protein